MIAKSCWDLMCCCIYFDLLQSKFGSPCMKRWVFSLHHHATQLHYSSVLHGNARCFIDGYYCLWISHSTWITHSWIEGEGFFFFSSWSWCSCLFALLLSLSLICHPFAAFYWEVIRGSVSFWRPLTEHLLVQVVRPFTWDFNSETAESTQCTGRQSVCSRLLVKHWADTHAHACVCALLHVCN